MLNMLRGDPARLVARIADAKRRASYKDRPDGTQIGPGYFGEVAHPDALEFFATELPFMVFNVAGHMSMLIPAIVPTLSREELAHLIDGGQPTLGIVEKAKRHAEARIAARLSPFAALDEQGPLPPKPEHV